MAESAVTTQGNQVIETNIINMEDSIVQKTIMEVQQHKEVLYTNNSPLASMTMIHPVVKKLFTKELPNVLLAGKKGEKLHATKKFCQ